MWNSFCCKDCGSHSYCDHKMNIAQNIYTTINNEQEERTYRDMEQLSIEEQFNIYADIVPPPSLPASQPPAEVYPGSSKKQQQKQQQKSQKYPPSKVASSSSTTSSSILSASYHKDTCLPSQQQAQQKHKEERLLETQDEGETEEKEANDDDDEEEELSTRKRRVVVVGGGDGDGKLKHVVKHQQESSFDMPMEDPVHIDKCLREMMEEIDDKTKPSNKVAYLQALQISPTYVQDKKFWLSFLRADYYNVKDASKRLIHHFEFKKELFCCGGGSSSNSNQNNLEILGRDVTLDDLTEEERQMLTETNKAFELKREYDPLGRSILIGRGQYVRYDNPLGMMRSVWYLLNDHVKDNEQIQQLGSINLMYMKGEFPKNMNYDLMQRGVSIFKYTPIKFVAVYALMDGERNPWSNVLDLMMFATARMMRMRSRSIYGSRQECLYSLLCLGFTNKNVPGELLEGVDKKRKRFG